MSGKITALLIAGPTASGKSDFALKLAEKLGGVIINADSMQVYADLQVLTARPGKPQLERAPHLLYGHVDGAVGYSTGRWLEDVADALSSARQDGLLPIIIGGTGLYFKALLEGLVAIPDIPNTIRETYRTRLDMEGPEALHIALSQRDPALAARIATSDGQRIVRGLEVYEATGTPLSSWQEQQGQKPLLQFEDTYPLVVSRERSEIYDRCDARFDQMIEEGALVEVARLKERELDVKLPVMKVIGVPQLMDVIDGKMSLEGAKEKVKTLTRRYAKRQLTWLKRNMIAWNHVFAQDSERILLDVLPKLRKNS